MGKTEIYLFPECNCMQMQCHCWSREHHPNVWHIQIPKNSMLPTKRGPWALWATFPWCILHVNWGATFPFQFLLNCTPLCSYHHPADGGFSTSICIALVAANASRHSLPMLNCTASKTQQPKPLQPYIDPLSYIVISHSCSFLVQMHLHITTTPSVPK